MTTSETPEPATGEWYWDKRNKKAYAPVRIGDDTVRFVTVWHREEVEGALEEGAVVPIEEIGLDRTETTFDLLDSFRLLDDDDLSQYVGGE